jgi:hypothetical protein
LSVPIAAALVSKKRHMKIRRLPNFVDKGFVSFSKLESNDACASLQVKDLKSALRSKVDKVVAHTSKEVQSLRNSIDATPEAASALKAKGLSSSRVVAINIVDGILTLFDSLKSGLLKLTWRTACEIGRIGKAALEGSPLSL